MQRLNDSGFIGNMIWLVASLFMATAVWYIAVTTADPISRRQFPSIAVQIVQDDTTILTNDPTRFASVTIQGGQTVVSSRRADDIIVRADLTGLGPGTHTIPLDVSVALPQSDDPQRVIAQTQPTQITVTLAQVESFQKPVEIVVAESPPTGYTHDEPVPEIFQVLVRGALNDVSQVVAARASLDLSDDRNPVETDVRLFPVDADGNRVEGVTVEPQTASISVNITRRDDVKQVSVRPNILVGTQPEGYTLSTFSYDPQTIFISGAPAELASIEDTFFTVPIDLAGRTSDFEIIVPVELPSDDLFVVSGDNNITVTVNIVAQVAVREFNNIEVERIGLVEGFSATIAPQTVSTIINGPSALVDNLSIDDIQVVVDLNGLAPGRYELGPNVVINQAELNDDNASLLPAVLTVEIFATEPTAEATEESIPIPTPTP